MSKFPLVQVFNLVLFIVIFSKCNNSNTNPELKNQRKMDSILYELFVNKYPNYENNELVRTNAAFDLQLATDTLAHLHYLEDIPLKVLKVSMLPTGTGAIAHFYADNQAHGRKDNLSSRLQFDIIGFMDIEEASEILESNKYLVYGKNYDRMTDGEIRLVTKQTYYSSYVQISRDNGTSKFGIGVFSCEVDSIKVSK